MLLSGHDDQDDAGDKEEEHQGEHAVGAFRSVFELLPDENTPEGSYKGIALS